MKNLGYYNGKYDLIENMTVPMNDRACYFGDGIFEVAYSRNYKIYSLDEHMDRLYDSADILGLNIPITKDEFSALLYEFSAKVDSDEQHIYRARGYGTLCRATPANKCAARRNPPWQRARKEVLKIRPL